MRRHAAFQYAVRNCRAFACFTRSLVRLKWIEETPVLTDICLGDAPHMCLGDAPQ
jgi:hypothetical protein